MEARRERDGEDRIFFAQKNKEGKKGRHRSVAWEASDVRETLGGWDGGRGAWRYLGRSTPTRKKRQPFVSQVASWPVTSAQPSVVRSPSGSGASTDFLAHT